VAVRWSAKRLALWQGEAALHKVHPFSCKRTRAKSAAGASRVMPGARLVNSPDRQILDQAMLGRVLKDIVEGVSSAPCPDASAVHTGTNRL